MNKEEEQVAKGWLPALLARNSVSFTLFCLLSLDLFFFSREKVWVKGVNAKNSRVVGCVCAFTWRVVVGSALFRLSLLLLTLAHLSATFYDSFSTTWNEHSVKLLHSLLNHPLTLLNHKKTFQVTGRLILTYKYSTPATLPALIFFSFSFFSTQQHFSSSPLILSSSPHSRIIAHTPLLIVLSFTSPHLSLTPPAFSVVHISTIPFTNSTLNPLTLVHSIWVSYPLVPSIIPLWSLDPVHNLFFPFLLSLTTQSHRHSLSFDSTLHSPHPPNNKQ